MVRGHTNSIVFLILVITGITFLISHEFSAADTESEIGIIWDKQGYLLGETAKIIVKNPSLNSNAWEIDVVEIHLKSDSNPEGIEILVRETWFSSGIFESSIVFTNEKNNLGIEMLVSQGDIVYATYDDFEIEYTTLIMGTSTFNQEKFSVSTEATKFQTGDEIRIFGTVSEFNYGKPVIIKILNPSDEPILVKRIEVSPDKKFDIIISETVGILWESSGTYSVIAQYDPKFESTLTTFEFYSTNWIVPQEAITINTDKTSYMFGEKIMVTGLIRDLNPHHTVDLTLTVNHQNGIIVTKILFPPNDDGSFSSEIITNTSQWQKIGEYVLIVSYEGHSSSKTFLISDTN